MRVARPEGVEHHRTIRQQVLEAFGPEPDRAGKDAERIGLGDVRYGVDPSAPYQPIREPFGGVLEAGAQARHRLGRERAVEHGAAAGMQRRVGLQNEARWAKGFRASEIVDADAGRRTESLPVGERRLHLGMARRSVNSVALQPHDRTRLAQRLVEGIGIREKLVAEGIDVRNSGGAVGHGHFGFLPCGLPLRFTAPPPTCKPRSRGPRRAPLTSRGKDALKFRIGIDGAKNPASAPRESAPYPSMNHG